MKIVREESAERSEYASTSSVLDYSFALDEKVMDFCINRITGRYPIEGYCSNLEVEELCYILEGDGIIHKRNNGSIEFKKGDVVL